jgi:hypothetical protein
MIIEHEATSCALDGRSGADVTTDAIEDILRRYPNVFQVEIDRAVMFLSSAPMLQRAVLSARPGMPARIEQLRRDHPKAFRTSSTGYAIVALLIAAAFLLGYLLSSTG